MDRTSNAWVKMIAAKILASSFKVQFELLSDVFSTIFGPFLSIIMGLICYFKMSLCRGRLGLRRLIGLWDSKAPISLRLARYIIVKVYEGHVSWPLHSLFSLRNISSDTHCAFILIQPRHRQVPWEVFPDPRARATNSRSSTHQITPGKYANKFRYLSPS